MVGQAEIQRVAQSKDVVERIIALDEIRYNFAVPLDGEQAWRDLLTLTKDKDRSVRED